MAGLSQAPLFRYQSDGGSTLAGSPFPPGLGAAPTRTADPEQAYASIIRRDRKIFDEEYAPLLRDIRASLRDTSLVDEANRSTATLGERATAQAGRDSARLGLGQTALERREAGRLGSLSTAATSADTVNNARIDQFERNSEMRRKFVAAGRGIDVASQEGLSASADNQSARNTAYKNAKAQQKAAETQAIGQALGTALLFFAL